MQLRRRAQNVIAVLSLAVIMATVLGLLQQDPPQNMRSPATAAPPPRHLLEPTRPSFQLIRDNGLRTALAPTYWLLRVILNSKHFRLAPPLQRCRSLTLRGAKAMQIQQLRLRLRAGNVTAQMSLELVLALSGALCCVVGAIVADLLRLTECIDRSYQAWPCGNDVTRHGFETS